MKKEIREIVDRHIPSSITKDYIFNFYENKLQIISDAVLTSQLNIYTKLKDLKYIRDFINIEDNQLSKINKYIDIIEKSIDSFNKDGLFILELNSLNHISHTEYITQSSNNIQKYLLNNKPCDIYDDSYYYLEKFYLDENNDYIRESWYIISETSEIIFTGLENDEEEYTDKMGSMPFFYYLPLKIGDIVEVKSSSFNESYRYIIIDNCNEKDSEYSSLQGMRKIDGEWYRGSVYRFKMNPNYHVVLGGVFIPDHLSIEIFDGELPEDEKILKTLSDIIKEIPEENKKKVYDICYINYEDEDLIKSLEDLK